MNAASNVVRVADSFWCAPNLKSLLRDASAPVDPSARLRRAVRECESALLDARGMDRLTYPVREVAAMLGMPADTVRAWVRSGKLAVVRFGAKSYIERDVLLGFIADHRDG